MTPSWPRRSAARLSKRKELFEIQREALALQTENQHLRAEIDRFRSTRFHHKNGGYLIGSNETELVESNVLIEPVVKKSFDVA